MNYDFISQRPKFNSPNKKKKKLSFIYFIFFIFFIFYTFFVVFIVSFIIRKKMSNNTKGIKTYSNMELLKLMTLNDKALYEGAQRCLYKNPDDELCIYQFLCPKKVQGKTLILLGDKLDGSYVILDDFENIKIAYSIGIFTLVQFDKALADRGIDVYMYDHTIDKLPYENDKFHWKKIGLGANSTKENNLQTLEEMMKENGHLQEKNMILKIDIEYNEWNSLNDISENVLCKFKYILVEFHFWKNEQKLYYDVLKKLHKTHQPFYIRCGSGIVNFGNNRICDCIEASYIIRSGNSFTTDKTIYPIPEFSSDTFISFNINIFKLFDDYTQ
jgi:hypothetical protein